VPAHSAAIDFSFTLLDSGSLSTTVLTGGGQSVLRIRRWLRLRGCCWWDETSSMTQLVKKGNSKCIRTANSNTTDKLSNALNTESAATTTTTTATIDEVFGTLDLTNGLWVG